MPNRIIKESICISDSIDQLTWFEEVLFYRLIVNCDDYGRFDGRTAVIKNRLFPLKENLTAKAVEAAINRLASLGLVTLYMFEGKRYLYLPTWNEHQTIRAKRSRFPGPRESDFEEHESICNHMQADASKCFHMQADAAVIQSESESESNPNPNPNISAPTRASAGADKIDYQAIVDLYHSLCPALPRVRELTDQRKKTIAAKIKAAKTMEDFALVFDKAQKSDFLTGRSGAWHGCGFDWILKPANWAKIAEGNYDNERGQVRNVQKGGIAAAMSNLDALYVEE